jgi:5-methylcytosine-specific restriction endonuclease McrA
LPGFEVSETELIDQLVTERQNGINRAFFTRIHSTWRARVELYLAECGNPETIAPWPEVRERAVGDRFRNLYLSPADESVQKPILEQLRKRTLTYCPACGEDGTPNTLDHYLPKEKYPEFAVSPANLFPMCDICQGAKGAKLLSSDNERLFVHPYFDAFIDTQLVELTIDGPYNAPGSIGLRPSDELNEESRFLVQRHLQELNIPSRYYRFFLSNYLRLLRLVKQMRAKGLDVLPRIETFKDMELLKSVNSWGHIFYDGVLRNEALLEYLTHADLPDV